MYGKRRDTMSDFFEELGKRITDVAEEITKKTGETIDIQKLKSKIRSLKRANERDLVEIGQMVYDKFQNGEVSELDYVALCEGIEKREEEAEKYEEEIQKIREAL